MAMNTAYLDLIATAGAAEISHIGLVDETGTELTGGTYSRLAVTWTASSSGLVRPTGDLPFDVPGGSTVAGWRGYDDPTAGTGYGGAGLTEQPFSSDGTYTLLSASTGIQHSAS